MSKTIAEIKGLKLNFYTYEGVVEALDGVNLNIRQGEILGIVGETGSGKSVSSFSILAIVPPPGKIENGHVLFELDGGTIDVLRQRDAYLRKFRGEVVSMVFQEPRAALNPIFTVNDQISEAILLHRKTEMCQRVLEQLDKELQGETPKTSKKTRRKKITPLRRFILKRERRIYERMLANPYSLTIDILASIPIIGRFKNRLKREATKEVVKILKDMRIPDPERVTGMYPHELSGGMAQRVVIAIALSCRPILLIADEPTTNLDVTVQAQILELIKELRSKFNSTILYITHDMGVIAETCDRVAVMYAGSVAEVADVVEIFKNPLHPYTAALLQSIPMPGKEFVSIEGTVPSLIDPPKGCRFHTRCKYAMDKCSLAKPKFVEMKPGHSVLCYLYTKEAD